MSCPNPSQAYFQVLPNGKKKLKFSNVLGRMFRQGSKMPDDSMAVKCRQCMTCKLTKSRVDAMRCTHEARMVSCSSFITLTYSDLFVSECPLVNGSYSLTRKHITDFIKRLREKLSRDFGVAIRIFGCGEYGEVCMHCKRSRKGKPPCVCEHYVSDLGRPHFHLCIFGFDFLDRVYEGGRDGFRYYSSKCLSGLWKFGFSSVCDFSFETAAYVARYCTKKITGKKAADHYRGRLPEFPIYPTRGGGLGKPWFDKYGKTDVIPTDSCIARYVKCGVPEYYDRLRARFDPEGLAEAKKLRSERAKLRVDDNTYSRLLDKEKCMKAKINVLLRRLEN